MKHAIQTDRHGSYGPTMASAVQACVHCGFCLTNCPTYRVMGQEMDSPRGRIILMKEVLEGDVPAEQALPHVDQCLGCLACETHCPSGVHYRDLLSPFRDRAEPERSRPLHRRVDPAAQAEVVLEQPLDDPDRADRGEGDRRDQEEKLGDDEHAAARFGPRASIMVEAPGGFRAVVLIFTLPFA